MLVVTVTPMLAALSFEPQIRGTLILITALLILVGSIFVLLATNMGVRLGFLVVATGLFGWLMLLTLLWTLTPSGTGPKGRDPAWKVEALALGDEISPTARPPLDTFPRPEGGWEQLEEGDRDLSEAQAAVDEALKSDAGEDLNFGDETDQGERTYELIAGHRKGGETYFFTLLHKPHYVALQLDPVFKKTPQPGQPVPEPVDDPDTPTVTVLLVRDLGTRRLPPFLAFLGSTIIFGVLVSILHRRDKQAMAARAATSGASVSPSVPAGQPVRAR